MNNWWLHLKTCWARLCLKMPNFQMKSSDCNWQHQQFAGPETYLLALVMGLNNFYKFSNECSHAGCGNANFFFNNFLFKSSLLLMKFFKCDSSYWISACFWKLFCPYISYSDMRMCHLTKYSKWSYCILQLQYCMESNRWHRSASSQQVLFVYCFKVVFQRKFPITNFW